MKTLLLTPLLLLAACTTTPAGKQAQADSAAIGRSNAAAMAGTSQAATQNQQIGSNVNQAQGIAQQIDAKDQVLLKAKWVQ